MNLSTSTPGFRLHGWHVLAIIVGFFAVIFAVNITFAVMAVRTFPGQVAVNPYEDGIAFNRAIVRQAAQQRLGWRAAASVSPDGSIVVRLVDRAGAPVPDLRVEGKLERPATEAGAITPSFVQTAAGTYVARTGALAGAWDLTFVAHDAAGRRFEAQRRLKWP